MSKKVRNIVSLFAIAIIFPTSSIYFSNIIPNIWNYPEHQIKEFQDSLPVNERLTPKEEMELINEYRNIFISNLISAIGTLATVIGGVVLYLNFLVANRNAKIANQNFKLTEERIISERFAKATEQLGGNILVRIGGIYSLEQIACDSPSDYWTVMEIIAAFIREKSPNKINLANEDKPTEDDKISTDIQAAMTVIGRCKPKDNEGRIIERKRVSEIKLNLSNTNLIGAYLFDNDLTYINFYNSDLRNSCLVKANLTRSNLCKANLRWSKLTGTILNNTDLTKADLSNTDLRSVCGLENSEVKDTIWPDDLTSNNVSKR